MIDGQSEAPQEWATIRALLTALTARGLHDADRAVRTAELALAIARRLGLDDKTVADVRALAALHDVGLIAMPDALLHSPDELDEDAREQLFAHPRIGAVILRSLPGLAHLAPLVEAEHERWDGRGYPSGLAGDDIPAASRVVLCCDAYLAMRTPRPDRPAFSHAVAIGVLRQNAGTQFWPAAAEALVTELESRPEPAEGARLPQRPNATGTVRTGTQVQSRRVPVPVSLRPPPARVGRTLFLAAILVGTVIGLLWALPLPSVDSQCPPSHEGQLWCRMQKSWLAAATKVLASTTGVLFLTWLVAVAVPQFLRGGYRQVHRPAPDGSDPLLAAASWTVTRQGPHEEEG